MLSNAVNLAHTYWEEILVPGDIVIDATCGNGHDTLFVAQKVLHERSGKVFGFDIQPTAIAATTLNLKTHLTHEQFNDVILIHGSHAHFPKTIQERSIKLIVYNLGYLPKGNKSIVTHHESSLESLRNAMKLIRDDGMISMTCYPGHPEGKVEEDKILEYVGSLSAKEWICCHHRWINRHAAPSLLLVKKL